MELRGDRVPISHPGTHHLPLYIFWNRFLSVLVFSSNPTPPFYLHSLVRFLQSFVVLAENPILVTNGVVRSGTSRRCQVRRENLQDKVRAVPHRWKRCWSQARSDSFLAEDPFFILGLSFVSISILLIMLKSTNPAVVLLWPYSFITWFFSFHTLCNLCLCILVVILPCWRTHGFVISPEYRLIVCF